MGPSGSGKTSLLNILGGKGKSSFKGVLKNVLTSTQAYYATTSGKIFINGKQDSIHKYKKAVGFVLQEDIMHRTLTVKECLAFSALLRLPNTESMKEKHAVINRVLDQLELQEVRHSIIGDE